MRFPRLFTVEQERILTEALLRIIKENRGNRANLEERFKTHRAKSSQRNNPHPTINNQPL